MLIQLISFYDVLYTIVPKYILNVLLFSIQEFLAVVVLQSFSRVSAAVLQSFTRDW